MQKYRDTERNRDTKGHTEKERDTETKMTLKYTKRKLAEVDTQINRHKVNMGTISILLIIVTSMFPKESLLLSWMDILMFHLLTNYFLLSSNPFHILKGKRYIYHIDRQIYQMYREY